MRLYKVVAVGNGERVVEWLGTQAECAATRKALNADGKFKRDEITTEEVDVPTTKQELLKWLNSNAV